LGSAPIRIKSDEKGLEYVEATGMTNDEILVVSKVSDGGREAARQRQDSAELMQAGDSEYNTY